MKFTVSANKIKITFTLLHLNWATLSLSNLQCSKKEEFLHLVNFHIDTSMLG